MIFETHELHAPLVDLIEQIFYYKDYVPAHSIERVVPTGNVFLLIELDDIYRHTFIADTLQPNATFKNAWISGMQDNHLSISAHPHSEMLVVCFKTYGAYPFLHTPISTLNGCVMPAEKILGEEILRLREQLKTEKTIANKFALTESFLLNKLEEHRLPPIMLKSIINELKNNRFSGHRDIVARYPKSQKTLILEAKKYCGLTPKTLHRIFRFNGLLEIIKEKHIIEWSHIAYETGYSDQSHFIKEFHNFCGFNPSSYISNEYNKLEPNFFPLNKKQEG